MPDVYSNLGRTLLLRWGANYGYVTVFLHTGVHSGKKGAKWHVQFFMMFFAVRVLYGVRGDDELA